MTLPQLPTDNLYKFIALSGLTLFVLTIYVYFQTEDANARSSAELDIEINAVQEHIINERNETIRQKIQIEKFCKKNGCNCLISFSVNHMELSYISDGCKIKPEVEQQANEYYQKLEKSIQKMNELVSSSQKKRTLVESNRNEWKKRKLKIYFLSGFGIILTSIGFIFWYKKVQKYQDIILKNQAKENV